MMFYVDKNLAEEVMDRLCNLTTDYDLLMVDLWKRTSPEHDDFNVVCSLINTLKVKQKDIFGHIELIKNRIGAI